MADNPKKYELVSWKKGTGQVPRWMLPVLHAIDKIAKAKWPAGPTKPENKDSAQKAYGVLQSGLGTVDWNTSYTLQQALDKQLVDIATKDVQTISHWISDAAWVEEPAIQSLFTEQWALWDSGKKPSDPSKKLLKIYGFPQTSGTSTVVVPPAPGPKPDPKNDNKDPTPEEEEGGFPWWILAVAGAGAAWFFWTDRKEKKRRRVIGSRI